MVHVAVIPARAPKEAVRSVAEKTSVAPESLVVIMPFEIAGEATKRDRKDGRSLNAVKWPISPVTGEIPIPVQAVLAETIEVIPRVGTVSRKAGYEIVSARVLVARVGSADLCGVRRYLPITGASPQSGTKAGREVLLGHRCSNRGQSDN